MEFNRFFTAGDGVLIGLLIFFIMIISMTVVGIFAFISKDFIDGVKDVKNYFVIKIVLSKARTLLIFTTANSGKQ